MSERNGETELVVVSGREVSVSNPDKVLFPQAGHTKRDLVRYYLSVADGALRAAGNRPNVLVRYPNGVGGEFFYQKRAPRARPSWIDVVSLHFPSGRTAEEVVPRDAAAPRMDGQPCVPRAASTSGPRRRSRPSRRTTSGSRSGTGCPVESASGGCAIVHATLDDFGLVGWPKTSGSRGIHVYVRIERQWTFDKVRRAALALAREVERRAPNLATSKWWKEERLGVFLDYNQNAKDRTVAAAYSVRPTPQACVSAPVTWDELDACEPGDFTLATMPQRFAEVGDRHAGIDSSICSLAGLLELSARHEREGLGDAPWPPQYKKQPGEPTRVQPSRRRTPKHPLIEIGRAAKKEDALAGFERWRLRHPEAAAHLEPADVLVDAMRGRFRTWTRIRVNLQHVPPPLRPEQEPLESGPDA